MYFIRKVVLLMNLLRFMTFNYDMVFIRNPIILGILFGFLGVTMLGVSSVFAQDGGGGQRYRNVEVESTQYIWHLVSNSNGSLICEVIVEHPGSPTQDEALTVCESVIYPPTVTATRQPGATPQPTEQPFDIYRFFQTVSWKLIETRQFNRSINEPLPAIIVNIVAPQGPLSQPYVILQAYEPVLEYEIAEIRGTVGTEEFVCQGAPCRLTLERDSLVTFYAVSTSGDESERITADVRYVLQSDGYYVNIAGMTPIPQSNDMCAQVWGVRPFGAPDWAEFPVSPEDLHTQKTLYYLANRLMRVGVVDAADCPGGGYFSPSSPNSCGLERSQTAMIEWQNQFDPVIYTSAYEYGVPPRIIKTLMEQESQFWPGNSRLFIFEFGLAQMNQLGADVSLRWDHNLYDRVCSGLFSDCTKKYASQPPWMQATLRGGLMRVINAECPTCEYGIDLFTAQQSVPIITQTLRANCYQVQYITERQNVVATYEDMWRFTLVSYNGGYQCLVNALSDTKRFNESTTWNNVSERLTCERTKEYVDSFWANLTSFSQYVIPPSDDQPFEVPSFAPTAVPTIAPTPVLAASTLRVLVYVDRDGDGVIDEDERVDGVTVVVRYEDGTSETRTVSQGEAEFNMSGKQINSSVTVSLPNLYRVYRTRIPAEGEVLVIFRLEEPPLPPVLP
jgi:hypothetical protein